MKVETEIGNFIKDQGIEKFGFAKVKDMKEAPPIQQPSLYLQKAQSLISLAVPLNLEVIQGLPETRDDYMVEFHRVNKILDSVANNLSKWLTQKGFPSKDIPNRDPNHWTKKRGDISHRHVAKVAGLGEFGWNNLLIIPKYYGAVRFSTVITTAKLEPTQSNNNPICKECGKCIEACPTGALVPIDGVKSKYDPSSGRFMEHEICRHHQTITLKKRCALCLAACLK